MAEVDADRIRLADDLTRRLRLATTPAELLQSWSLPSAIDAGRREEAAWMLEQEFEAYSNSKDETNRQARLALHTRRLFHASYTDLELVLHHVARHVAELRNVEQRHSLVDRNLVSSWSSVFLPLLEMLGMWELRRDSADRIARLLDGETYKALANSLAKAQAEHQAAYDEIVQSLDIRLRENGILPVIRIRPFTPFATDLRARRGATRSCLLNQLRVEVVVPSEEAVKVAVDTIEAAWPRISDETSRRIQQSPIERIRKFNGYTADVVRIITPESVPRGEESIVEFLVSSQDANLINRHGVVITEIVTPEQVPPTHAWWANQKTKKLVVAHEPGARVVTEEIYAFTPAGQVLRLPTGSTVIDFAFEVHAEVGYQCVGAIVNGIPAALSDVLTCGDIVHITQDPASPGPTEKWFGFAESTKARRAIRRALQKRSTLVPTGKQQFLTVLNRKLRNHEIISNFSVDLDRFLQTAATSLGFASVDEIYAELAQPSPRVHSKELVDRFIHQLLLPHIVASNGTEIASSERVVYFRTERGADGRRRFVVPGQPIQGYQLPSTPRHPNGAMFIYPRLHPNEIAPRSKPRDGEVIPLMWRPRHDSERAFNLTIHAIDRSELLRYLLEMFYAYYKDGLYLYELEAKVRVPDSYVDVHCKLVCRAFETIEKLKQKLSELSDDDVIMGHTLSELPPVEAALLANNIAFADPYTKFPLSGARVKWFFGRQHDVGAIRELLRIGNLVVLVGPTGIGKTTLLRVLHRRVFADQPHISVLVEGIGRWTEDDFWDTLLNELIKSLLSSGISRANDKLLETPSGLSKYAVFRTVLTELRKGYPRLRPVLLIDEFSDIDTDDWPETDARTVLRQIQLLVEEMNVTVIVGVHAPLRSFQGDLRSRPLRIGAFEHQLGPLDRTAAQELITVPLAGIIDFDPDAVERLYLLTGGYPLYLQTLLLMLYRHLRGFRTHQSSRIDLSHVDIASQKVISSGSEFQPLFWNAERIHPGVIAAVARATGNGEHAATLPAILDEVSKTTSNYNEVSLRTNLEAINDLGLLRRADAGDVPGYAFVVPLFAKWLISRYRSVRLR